MNTILEYAAHVAKEQSAAIMRLDIQFNTLTQNFTALIFLSNGYEERIETETILKQF